MSKCQTWTCKECGKVVPPYMLRPCNACKQMVCTKCSEYADCREPERMLCIRCKRGEW